MKYRTRTYYTDSQKALMWERWKQGQTLHQIAGLFDRHHGSIRQILAETGGIRPPERHRSRLASQADQAAWDRAHRPKRCKLAENRALAPCVPSLLKLRGTDCHTEVFRLIFEH